MNSKRYSEAATAYARYTQFKPNDSEGWRFLGDAYDEQGREADAAAAYRQALKVNPGDTDAAKSLAAVENACDAC